MAQVVAEAPPAAPAPGLKRRDALVIAAVLVIVAAGVAIAVANPRPPHVPDARAAGMEVYRDGTLYRIDGTTMRLDPPDEGSITGITAVPAGYLLDVNRPETNEAWLRDAGGTARRLASGISSHAVTGDGRFLVFATVSGAGAAIRAIEIATGVERHLDTFDSVVSVGGDWVIVGRDVHSTEPIVDTRAYALWNAATGEQIPFAGDRAVDPVSVAPDGRVLEIVYPGGRLHAERPQPVCVRLVAPTLTTVPSTGPGYCGTYEGLSMSASPDDTWATFTHYDGVTGTVRLDDVAAGRWTPIGPGGYPWRWDSPRTYIQLGGLGDNPGFTRCDLDGTCADLHLAGDEVLVFRAGV